MIISLINMPCCVYWPFVCTFLKNLTITQGFFKRYDHFMCELDGLICVHKSFYFIVLHLYTF